MPLPIIPKTTYNYLDYISFNGGYNSKDPDISVADNELTGGRNVDISPDHTLSTRLGHTLVGDFIGNTTKILGLIAHEPAGGNTELLAVYDTVIKRLVAGEWVSLTGVTLTTDLKTDFAHFPLTAKTYITNGTDYVVKYASGTGAVQTDTAFKKGKYIVHYKNRLLTSIDNIIWYTDLGVDTFSANNYIKTEGDITGLQVLYDKWLTFTKKKVYVTPNFQFNGVAAGPESFLPLRTEFGAIYDRTIVTIGNLCYFMGQDSQGIAAIYATDGYDVVRISDKIQPDFDNLSPSQLTNACAVAWGKYYRISVTPQGETTNTLEYLYDTQEKKWLPPYTSEGFSCYVNFESSGKLDVYAGSQINGRVYKLNQQDYDELIDQSNYITPDVHTAIDAASGAVKRASQGFKLSVTSPNTMYITGVAVQLKKNAGTTTELTLQIETDSSGKPSGTVVTGATGTIDAFTDASYVWKTVKFATPVELSAATTYHLVLKHTNEGTGNSQYYMGMKGTASTYANGIASAYTSSAWANIANTDASFIVLTESDYESYGDTKAFHLSPQGQKTRLKDTFITAKSTGNYTIQFGINTGESLSWEYNDFYIEKEGHLLGSTFVFGTSLFGSVDRIGRKIRLSGIRGRTMKFRFRKQLANRPFTIYGFRTRHQKEERFN
jgi:hypothetical protein